jgi:Protein of unknown function (DUF3300)
VNWSKPALVLLVAGALMSGAASGGFAAELDQSAAPPPDPTAPPQPEPASPAAQPAPAPLEQLVAPIAMYPDPLIAQILSAAANPTEIVEADRWMQQVPSLQAADLAKAVDQQPWDPSVKALTQFPPILANMDQNLAWTSALGQAYASQPQAVMQAIQALRRRAQQAGSLRSTPQETVTTNGETIVIEPASPQYVYVPEYDPWLVYGAPIEVYPGWVPYPGLFIDGPGSWFGVGIGIGVFGGFAWGWHHWRPDWHSGRMFYHHNPYFAHHAPFMGGHGPFGGHGGFGFNHGGFHGIGPHGGMGFHPGGFRGPAGFGGRFGGFHGGGHGGR